VAYVIVVVALLITATAIYVEGFLALDPYHPPPSPQEQDGDLPYPPASAVIAAYLPNEAATVVETVEAFLRVEYPGPLQVVLAYNTPHDLPVEATLQDLAERDDRLLVLRVPDSTSKAQNVNAALSQVTGDFTGVFDADHHPDPDSFIRAWRWLSAGYGIVQGHPVVRNGDTSWVARTVAVEFESIYAVSHPGRNRLHTFGIFGGSNGYWRTSLLRETRFRGSMLTEDIDSSLRVVEAGHRIGNDPKLITRELAPTDLKALWNQRMRWAQGWFQVSGKHLVRGWRSRVLTLRQKVGFTFLLGWRELYPWISMQVVPLIAFFAVDRGGLGALDWFIAILLLSTLFTVAVGPATTLFASWQAEPSIRQRRAWFWAYLVVSTFFYTEFKNTIARVAQIKELMGEKAWKVTPRSAPAEHGSGVPRGGVGRQPAPCRSTGRGPLSKRSSNACGSGTRAVAADRVVTLERVAGSLVRGSATEQQREQARIDRTQAVRRPRHLRSTGSDVARQVEGLHLDGLTCGAAGTGRSCAGASTDRQAPRPVGDPTAAP
jgi:cellulose synthase/poly-beta-1,6-N-acetylglucosamine synthase-like glycosyltransferase